jgi:hypothetical protein
MGMPVVTVAAGGLPVVDVALVLPAMVPLRGTPVTEAVNGKGTPVTKVANGRGLPVIYVVPPL